MEIVTNTALISINETLIVQVLSFLIFLFVINRLMFQPLRKTAAERNDLIQKMQQEIIDTETDAQRWTRELEKRKRALLREADKMRAEIESAGGLEADHILEQALAEISVHKKTARLKIDAQINEAKQHLAEESETLALFIMENVLDRRLPHESTP